MTQQPWPQSTAPTRGAQPLRALLIALIGLAAVALGSLTAIGLMQPAPEYAYANDDYAVPPPDASPPPIPIPQSVADAEQWTRSNPVYAAKMPAPIRCELPRIDFAEAADAELKSHFEGLMECLVRAWYLPTQQAGFTLVRPTVTIYGDEVQTKCGRSGINAMYCGADQQVYYSRLITTRAPILKTNPWAADVVIAHEFGHAIQGRTGILGGDLILENRATDKQERLLLSRRTENQADCFSGLFMRAVSASIGLKDADVPLIIDAYYQFGADVLSGKPNIESDHGLAATRRYWGGTGLARSDIEACNTFTADKSLVR